jgi:hypothetical protein
LAVVDLITPTATVYREKFFRWLISDKLYVNRLNRAFNIKVRSFFCIMMKGSGSVPVLRIRIRGLFDPWILIKPIFLRVF